MERGVGIGTIKLEIIAIISTITIIHCNYNVFAITTLSAIIKYNYLRIELLSCTQSLIAIIKCNNSSNTTITSN